MKVQYPGIEEKFRSDLATIMTFAKLAQPQHVKPLGKRERVGWLGGAASSDTDSDTVFSVSSDVCRGD